MKNLYTLIVIALVGFIGNAQIVNIPDANFKAKLLSASATNQVASTETPDSNGNVITHAKIDTNNDGQIQLSEALAITWLDATTSSISDLTGIQSFSNLIYLSCGDNSLMNLNISTLVNLQFLYCYNNQLSSLNTSNSPDLSVLQCGRNSISNLNIINCLSLNDLECEANHLTTLNVPNRPNLIFLDCSQNLLTSINIIGDLSLLTFYFNNNQLQNINLNPFVNLIEISMGANPYTSVVNLSTLINLQTMFLQDLISPAVSPLTDSVMPSLVSLATLKTDGSNFGNMHYYLLPALTFLLCRNTGLTSLSTIPTTISQLVTEANLLTTVDLTAFTSLTIFQSYNNPITSIVLGSHPGLFYLDLGKSQLTSIDVSGLPALTNFNMNRCPLLTSCDVKNGLLTNFYFRYCPNLQSICADNAAINNIQTAIATNAASYNGNPNCQVTSNCQLTVEEFTNNDVVLYPNPAKNSLTITTKQDVTISSISIYNMLGQLVQVQTNPTESIDVSGLQSGSYFMRIASDKGSATGKFIKE